MFCQQCGTQIPEVARYCSGCGELLPPPPLPPGRQPSPPLVPIKTGIAPSPEPAPTLGIGRILLAVFVAGAGLIILFVAVAVLSGPRNGTPGIQYSSSASSADSARDAAVVADLDAWWKKATYSPAPEKPGTVTPGRTITSKGRAHSVPRHVQTKAEYQEEAEDFRWNEHRRSIVTGFSVTRDTVSVMTTLTRNSTYALNPMDIRDAQELCHDLGAFLWARENRHWGLNNIRIVGGSGELLSSRTGLAGKVQ